MPAMCYLILHCVMSLSQIHTALSYIVFIIGWLDLFNFVVGITMGYCIQMCGMLGASYSSSGSMATKYFICTFYSRLYHFIICVTTEIKIMPSNTFI